MISTPPKWSDHVALLVELRDIPPVPVHPPCALSSLRNKLYYDRLQPSVASLFGAQRLAAKRKAGALFALYSSQLCLDGYICSYMLTSGTALIYIISNSKLYGEGASGVLDKLDIALACKSIDDVVFHGVGLLAGAKEGEGGRDRALEQGSQEPGECSTSQAQPAKRHKAAADVEPGSSLDNAPGVDEAMGRPEEAVVLERTDDVPLEKEGSGAQRRKPAAAGKSGKKKNLQAADKTQASIRTFFSKPTP